MSRENCIIRSVFYPIFMRLSVAVSLLLLAMTSTFSVLASDYGASFINEFRIGSFRHDVENLDDQESYDLNAELLFHPLRVRNGNHFFDYFLSPRPHIGASYNLRGNETDEYCFGLTWNVPMGDKLFLEASFGGAIHDGKMAHYGCRANFRESASLGITISEKWRLIGTIDHMSNANLCDNNDGLTNAGLRLGYRFN